MEFLRAQEPRAGIQNGIGDLFGVEINDDVFDFAECFALLIFYRGADEIAAPVKFHDLRAFAGIAGVGRGCGGLTLRGRRSAWLAGLVIVTACSRRSLSAGSGAGLRTEPGSAAEDDCREQDRFLS